MLKSKAELRVAPPTDTITASGLSSVDAIDLLRLVKRDKIDAPFSHIQETSAKFRVREGGGYINEEGFIFTQNSRHAACYQHACGKRIYLFYSDSLNGGNSSQGGNYDDLILTDYLWSDGSRITKEDKELLQQHLDEINLGWGGTFRVC